jgi:hypothetical protein
MHREGFDPPPPIPVLERTKAFHALGRATTGGWASLGIRRGEPSPSAGSARSGWLAVVFSARRTDRCEGVALARRNAGSSAS